MRQRWRCLFGVAIAAALVIASCSTTTPETKAETSVAGAGITSVIVGRGALIEMDPTKTDSLASIEQMLMVYEPLLQFDPVTQRPVPAAARELPTVSADGLRYRITLREGLVFSDRVPVRAHDFAYGISRFCDPQIGAPYAPTLFAIVGCSEWAELPSTAPVETWATARKRLMSEGIRVLSDGELEIVLKEPASYFTSVLALWLALPVRQQDIERGGTNWWSDPATFIGNGPFVLVEFTPNERIVFRRNERARVPAKLATWTKLFQDENEALDAYRTNGVDHIPVSAAQYATVSSDAALRSQLHVVDNGCTTFLILNHARAPFDDANVRLAFAKSIDRDAYIKEVRPLSRAATSFIAVGIPGHDRDDGAQKFDPSEARALLAKSRYSSATLPAVTWIYRVDRPDMRSLAEWFVGQWRRNLGVDVGLRPATLNEFIAIQRSVETTPHVAQATWCSDYPHQQNWLSYWFSPNGSLTAHFGYRNAEVGDLLRSADREPAEQTRDALYQRASRLISAEAGMIWLAYVTRTELVKPHVRGVIGGPFTSARMRPADVYVAPP